MLDFENFEWDRIVTPIDVGKLDQYLKQSEYNPILTTKLVKGFSRGFDIGYRGGTKL